MQNKTLLCCTLLLTANIASAQQSPLDAAAQSMQNADSALQNLENAPAAVSNQVQQSAVQQLNQTTAPAIGQAQSLTNQVQSAPNAADAVINAVDNQAKQKAAAEALKLLQ